MGEGQGTTKNTEIADKCAIKIINSCKDSFGGNTWVETLTWYKHENLKYAYYE